MIRLEHRVQQGIWRFCPRCRDTVVVYKDKPAHLVHGIVSLFFLPWLLVWGAAAAKDRARCPMCGCRTYRDAQQYMWRFVFRLLGLVVLSFVFFMAVMYAVIETGVQ